jgi:hypothetical protein
LLANLNLCKKHYETLLEDAIKKANLTIPHEGQVVYFAKRLDDLDDVMPIKIGTTTQLPNRMSYLKTRELATEPGGRLQERLAHHRFRDERIIGTEWFRRSDELMWYISQLRDLEGRPKDASMEEAYDKRLAAKILDRGREKSQNHE